MPRSETCAYFHGPGIQYEWAVEDSLPGARVIMSAVILPMMVGCCDTRIWPVSVQSLDYSSPLSGGWPLPSPIFPPWPHLSLAHACPSPLQVTQSAGWCHWVIRVITGLIAGAEEVAGPATAPGIQEPNTGQGEKKASAIPLAIMAKTIKLNQLKSKGLKECHSAQHSTVSHLKEVSLFTTE